MLSLIDEFCARFRFKQLFRCSDVEDTNSQDMRACWTACVRFIDSAVGVGATSAAPALEFAADGSSRHCANVLVLASTGDIAGASVAASPDAAARGRVLIQLHGRSRSASVAIAWLMRRHCASFEQALAALRACHIPVDGSLIYAAQLRQWAAESS
jgi:hypothetical protein